MNRALVGWLLRLYPRAWRARYGEEIEELLCSSRGDFRTIIDVLHAAVRERCSSATQPGLVMRATPGSILALSSQPSAFVPMAMSIAAFVVVLSAVAGIGAPPPHADEGAAAHIWQLLMLCQVPEIVWFACKWLRRAPRQTVWVLGIQLALALGAMLPVYLLRL